MEGEGAPPPPQIKLKGVSMVAPAHSPQSHRMFLTNLDLLWLSVNNRSLLFYKLSPENEYSSTIEGLKKGLSSVLVPFYPMAGRLVEGHSGRLEVDCNGEGVEFIEASTNIQFEDLEKEGFTYKPYFNNFASTPKSLEKGDHSTPLLSIQVTSFEGGSGMCIGVAIQHVIADGMAFWHFLKSWGECSRGLPVSNPPVHNRSPLKVDNTSLLPISFKPHAVSNDRLADAQIFKYLPDTSQSGHENIKSSIGETDRRKENIHNWEHQTEPLKYSTFHFTDERIRQLKQRTMASTSFNALAAHFWRSVVKARKIPEEELVHFQFFADCRARMTPPLPPTYFGNCLCLGLARTTAKKLLTEDASFAAQLIKEAITSCTEEEQIRYMNQWLESPQGNLRIITEEIARGYCTNAVGSLRLPVDEVDYGWGKPLNSQMATTNAIGEMVMVGVRNEELGVAVSTCLPSNMMEKLAHTLLD